jgi:signal transduction histidine kinase
MPDIPRPKVLFVDDEPAFLAGIRANLRAGYQVFTAESAAQGLVELEHHGPFPVVVSDLRMPGMDGIGFLAEVRRRQDSSVRILLTGNADLDSAIAAVNRGHVFRFIEKPCPTREVIAAVEDALVQYRRITADRELLHREVERLTTQLLHAERLTTLGILAGGVGHELNNICHVLRLQVGMLADRAEFEEPPSREDIRELDWVLGHLENHGRNLLELGRPSQQPQGVHDLREITGRVLTLLDETGRTKYVRVLPEFCFLPTPVRARPHELEQVLFNLVNNAVDALGSQPQGDKRIYVRTRLEEDRILLTVEDNGSGIPDDQQERVFEPYFTTKPADCGTGLGLPVVRQIVESYGGSVSLQSQEGCGASFTVSLPLAEPEEPE